MTGSLEQGMLPQEVLDLLSGQSAHGVPLDAGHVAACHQGVEDGLLRGFAYCREEGIHAIVRELLDGRYLLRAEGARVPGCKSQEDIAGAVASLPAHA